MDKSKRKLLYVDDEQQNLQGFKIAFYDEYDVLVANSASEALEILPKQDVMVVVSDQRMPGMSGLEMFDVINKKYPDIVCIILTAFADAGAMLQAVNQGGVYRFLLKPWNELELKIAINQAFERNYYKRENRVLMESLKMKNHELSQSNEELMQTSSILKEREIKLKEQNEEYLTINEELTQTIAELEIAKEMAEESDKLKRAFLQNISHEIRTPMNAIVGFSSLLNDSALPQDRISTYTNIIHKSSMQLLGIVSDVLTISAIDTGQEKVILSDIHLLPFLEDLNNIFSSDATQKKLLFSMKHEGVDEQTILKSDRIKLNQIISNLISNAIKYTPEGFVEFGCNIENDQVIIYVKDSGIGISPEHHKLIFERFSRVESEQTIMFSGTGLGLAISKAMVDLLDGRIWVESELGKGSTFKVSFPYNTDANHATPENTSNSKAAGLAGLTILVAEDEYNNYIYLHDTLQSAGIKVLYAENGLEALKCVKNSEHIDMVLMDIRMPVMNGIEATRKIREFDKNIPIVAQTAYASFKEECGDDNLFNGFIIKPMEKKTLLDALGKFLSKS